MEEKYITINISDTPLKCKTISSLLENLNKNKDRCKEDTEKYNKLIKALEWANKTNFKDCILPDDNNQYYRLGITEDGNMFSIQLWDAYNENFDRRVRNVYSSCNEDLDNDDDTIII